MILLFDLIDQRSFAGLRGVALELYKLDSKENIRLKRGTRLVVNVSNIVYLGQKMPHFF